MNNKQYTEVAQEGANRLIEDLDEKHKDFKNKLNEQDSEEKLFY